MVSAFTEGLAGADYGVSGFHPGSALGHQLCLHETKTFVIAQRLSGKPTSLVTPRARRRSSRSSSSFLPPYSFLNIPPYSFLNPLP